MTFSIPLLEQPQRIDITLARLLKKPRHVIQKAIRQGCQVANRKIFKPSVLLRGGEEVEIRIPEQGEIDLIPEEEPLDILFEDEALLVVNKPAGTCVHPTPGLHHGTLVNRLLAHYPNLPVDDDPLKPGIVHRLDRGTSGCLLIAKSLEAMQALRRQFQEREVEKIYQALVYGTLASSGEIEKPIGRHSKRGRFSSHARKGRWAKTGWEVMRSFGKVLTLLKVFLYTGRTHQIRVHLTELGHPLVGDPLYRRAKHIKKIPSPLLQTAIRSIKHPALHAWRISLTHPTRARALYFEAPLPLDLQNLINLCERELCT